jgi:hypothetical protein
MMMDVKRAISGETNLGERALSRGGRDVGDLDLELAVVVGRASSGSRGVGLDLLSDTLGDGRGDNGGREDSGGSDGVTHVGGGWLMCGWLVVD